jgi:hypothetical protein
MEQLEQSGDFVGDCRRLFAPEHGRRWKTAAADALAIGRPLPPPERRAAGSAGGAGAPRRARQTAGQSLRQPVAQVDRCMAEYDENGWVGDRWLNPDGRAGAR